MDSLVAGNNKATTNLIQEINVNDYSNAVRCVSTVLVKIGNR